MADQEGDEWEDQALLTAWNDSLRIYKGLHSGATEAVKDSKSTALDPLAAAAGNQEAQGDNEPEQAPETDKENTDTAGGEDPGHDPQRMEQGAGSVPERPVTGHGRPWTGQGSRPRTSSGSRGDTWQQQQAYHPSPSQYQQQYPAAHPQHQYQYQSPYSRPPSGAYYAHYPPQHPPPPPQAYWNQYEYWYSPQSAPAPYSPEIPEPWAGMPHTAPHAPQVAQRAQHYHYGPEHQAHYPRSAYSDAAADTTGPESGYASDVRFYENGVPFTPEQMREQVPKIPSERPKASNSSRPADSGPTGSRPSGPQPAMPAMIEELEETDPDLANLMLAWYYTGYYTAKYQMRHTS